MALCGRLRRLGNAVLVGVAAAVDLLVWDADRYLRGGQLLPLWVVPVFTLAVYPALLLRWRHPVSVFALQWIYALSGLLLPGYGPFAGLLVALHALARRCYTRTAGWALGACAVPFTINSYNVAVTAVVGDPAMNLAGSLVLWAALALTVWGLGRLAYAADRRSEQLRRAETAAALRAERMRLARELHDIVAHAVSVMILQAAGARTLLPHGDGPVRSALEVIETAGVQAMDELHRLLELLRAASPDDSREERAEAPSLRDLHRLVGSAHASGVDVEVVVDGKPAELDHSVNLAAYRIVQEALTNTVKHAGRGASARIHLVWDASCLTLTVRDQGGLAPPGRAELSSGHGLTGLTERVTLVGGHLETGHVPGGFLVRARLPVRAATSAEPAAVASRMRVL